MRRHLAVRARIAIGLAAVLALGAATATAQVIKEPDDPLDAAATSAPPPKEDAAASVAADAEDDGGAPAGSGSAPLVLAVRVHAGDEGEGPDRAGLGERISVKVRGLTKALEALPTGCAGLVLFLDGAPIQGSPPESCTPLGADGAARFLLDRTEKSGAAWHALLGSPDGMTRKIAVSVGPEGNIAWPTKVNDFELEVLPKGWFAAYLLLLVLAAVVFVRLARRTALLRDPHAVPPAGTRAPYSLSRCQLGFWTFLTIAAYVFIWMITEELDTITGSVLALLGIGSGTALGASMIAQGKAQPAGMGAQAAGTSPAAPVVETSTAPAAGAAASLTPGPAMTRIAASQGFLTDLLYGSQGLSLYRFQMMAWTLVLGIIFVVQVYGRLAMPEFSASLLGLMGISSATYLGAKFPEE